MQLRFEKQMFAYVPWGLVGVSVVVAAIGVWNLASASRATPAPVWPSQLMYLFLGVVAMVLMALFDYRALQRMVIPIYVINLGLLVLLPFIGHKAKGAESWILVGPFRLQPAEFMKIGMVLAMASYFHHEVQRRYGLIGLAAPAIIALVPTGLVLVQPDLGTALMMVFTTLSILLFAGVRWWVGGALGSLALVGLLVLWNDYVRDQPEPRTTVVRHRLKKHQDARIAGWLDPQSDPKGKNYHAIQSKIAVGSGGTTGKGWGEGTQTGLFYLPEQHTDFIFSVWAEEHGFLACLLLLGLYGVMLVSALSVAFNARDRFGAFTAVGVAAMIFWQVFENIGMVTGLLPVTGITLPLMSFGGSSMVSVFISLGLLVNISMRRHIF